MDCVTRVLELFLTFQLYNFKVSGTSIQFCDVNSPCRHELNSYCCSNPYPHCCDYASYVNDTTNINNETFLKSGLKSALVLLLMSSAIFLLCFCVMKCCRRATPSYHRGGTLADYRGHTGMVPLTRQLSSRTLRIIGLTVDHPPDPVIDEPPSYNEVESSTEPISDIEKPPPAYSSIFKDSDT